MLTVNPDFLTFTNMRFVKTKSKMYSENPVRIVRARKTRELLSDRRGTVGIFELFTYPILNPIVYS